MNDEVKRLVENIHTRLDTMTAQLTELMAADRRRTDELTSQLKKMQQDAGMLRGLAAQVTNANRPSPTLVSLPTLVESEGTDAA